MVERKSGKIEVIVAGGSLPGSELSTEIFSVTDNRWRTGPKLPQAIVYGVSVPYRVEISTNINAQDDLAGFDPFNCKSTT